MPTAERHGRLATGLVLVVALVAALLPNLATPAHADAGVEAAFVSRVNQERAAHGLPALTLAGDLTTVARAHSGVMASAVDLHHQPDLGGAVRGWRKVGENVGRGPSVDAIHRAFMASPGHAKNVLDPDWTQIGIGVEVRDGRIWVTELFRLPSGAEPPAPSSTPAADSTPAPAKDGAPESAAAAQPVAAPNAPASSAPSAADGAPAPEAPPPPDDPAFDRLTVTLARVEAAEQGRSVHDLLAGA